MAIYNTSSDSANTAVRAFLTKVGEHYLGHPFNTGSGNGKALWLDIKNNHFNNRCAYCDQASEQLQIEHVIMFNRTEYGLHHPGNIIPCCKTCNKREKDSQKKYLSWDKHLALICKKRKEEAQYESRKRKILDNFKKYNYPNLNENEKHAIRVIAGSLYENIKSESEKSLKMYRQLDEAFVK